MTGREFLKFFLDINKDKIKKEKAIDEYFDFMKLLEGAAFVITDGGSNQEELSYMGKPCLILRTHTERSDGLGQNVVMYQESMQVVDDFIAHYPNYQRPPIVPAQSPARMIATTLTKE